MRHAPSRRGFTLIELVVVILLIGIVAAVAQPRFARALTGYRINASATRVVTDLEYASTLARVSSKPVRIRFVAGDDGGRHYYRFDEVADPGVPGRTMDTNDSSTWYTVRLSDDPYTTLILSAPASIEYDIYGLPDADADIVVISGSQQRTVSVLRSGGKATIQ